MSIKKQRGVGLAELLVGTAIMATVMVFVTSMISRAASDKIAHGVADDFVSFQSASARYFEANRAAIKAAAIDGTGADKVCIVNVNASGIGTAANSVTLHTCAFDASLLKYSRALPDGVAATNVYGQKWVAIFRVIYDAAGTTPTDSVDMLTVATDGTATTEDVDKRRWNQVAEAAASAGGNMGVLPDGNRGSCLAERASATYKACGNGWQVDLKQFISQSELAVFAAGLPN